MADKKCKYCKIKYPEEFIFDIKYEPSNKKYKFCDGTSTNCMLTEPWWGSTEPSTEDEEEKMKKKEIIIAR